MKQTYPYIHICILSLSLLANSFGGETDNVVYTPPSDSASPSLTSSNPDAFEWLKISGDLRVRYESRDLDGLDPSNSITARGRLGLTLGDFNGFSAFGEIEATTALVDDFQSNPAGQAGVTPFVPNNTVISDPESVELNRAWIQYKGNGFLAKYGRQRIIRNDAFFVGNVGWRQNEQTFDAAQIGFSNDDFSLSYVYSYRANRIFGNDARGALGQFEGDFHFIDGSFNTSLGKIGAYAYLIDVDNNDAVGESNTFGAFANLGPVYLEAAYQDGSGNLADDIAGGDREDDDAFLIRGKYTLKTNVGAFSAGVDWMKDDFKTPFQTAHAPFGFADAFILQQIGLNEANGFDGIFDGYIKYVKTGLPGGLTFKGDLHYFASEDFATTYGYEVDAVLVKKFTPNLTGLIKAAYFLADNSSDFRDIKQITADLSYKF